MRTTFGNIRLFCMLCLVLSWCSCSMFENRKQTVFFLTFHEFVSRPEQLEGGLVMAVKTADETVTRYVRTIPLLNSAFAYRGEVIPSKNKSKCGVRLFFNQHSQGMLHDACFYNKGRELAVIVDGFLAGYSQLNGDHIEDGYIEIAPLWHPLEAKAIVDHVESNYREYN